MAEINNETLNRIADALERIAPLDSDKPSLDGADAFIWYTDPDRLIPIKDISRVDLELLQGIDHVRDILLQNTEQLCEEVISLPIHTEFNFQHLEFICKAIKNFFQK